MAYDDTNIFARILRGEIPNKTVYEDDRVLAFHDIAELAPVHVLVIPKGPYESLDHFTAQASVDEIGHFFAMVGQIARDLGTAENGYRVVTNCGPDGLQEVPHFHVHILGGERLWGLKPRRRPTTPATPGA